MCLSWYLPKERRGSHEELEGHDRWGLPHPRAHKGHLHGSAIHTAAAVVDYKQVLPAHRSQPVLRLSPSAPQESPPSASCHLLSSLLGYSSTSLLGIGLGLGE